MTDGPIPVRLNELADELLDKAHAVHSGRAARGVYAGGYLRQAMLTLVAGAELAEHESPPEATLQVLRGIVMLSIDSDSCRLSAGELIVIPPQRHSVTAVEDSVFILTIRTDITER